MLDDRILEREATYALNVWLTMVIVGLLTCGVGWLIARTQTSPLRRGWVIVASVFLGFIFAHVAKYIAQR